MRPRPVWTTEYTVVIDDPVWLRFDPESKAITVLEYQERGSIMQHVLKKVEKAEHNV